MIQVSPGVYSREIDLSLYAPALATTIYGIVGGAHKGPLNQVYPISTVNEYVDVFGVPTNQMGYAALQYLRKGRQLKVLRVADGAQAKSHANLLDGTSAATLIVRAISHGVWADGLQVATTAGTSSGVKLTVLDGGYPVESWDNVTKANFLTATTGSKFIELADANPSNLNNPAAGNTVTLEDGADGANSLDDADYIGTVSGDTYTGLQAFGNSETLDVNLLAVPGVSSAPVINAGLSLAQQRADAFYLVDPPFGLTSNQVVDWHNGAGAWSGLHQPFNSSYGALQWSWHQVYDAYSASKVWIAPSGVTAAVYAYSDSVSETWFAPAGLTRGRVLDSLALESSPDLGKRDMLYGGGNCVNPFVNFAQDGICLYGQRTLQRMPSALDRVNVRRLMLYVEKLLATTAHYLTFNPHDRDTWTEFIYKATSVLEPIKARRGFYDYRVICDDTTNTPDLIDQNKMVGKCLVKPTKAAEIIQIDWNILSTGAEFTEIA